MSTATVTRLVLTRWNLHPDFGCAVRNRNTKGCATDQKRRRIYPGGLLIFISVVFLLVCCSVNLSIVPDLQNPITISLEGAVEVLTPDSEMTVTAHTDPPDTENMYLYQWYLGGESLHGENGPSITIKGCDLPPGSYRLDVEITAGAILSSESCVFVLEYP